MTLNRAVIFKNYLASIVSLIFLAKTLIWNKIMFLLSNSLNFAELVENALTKRISKKFISLSIQFITAYCKNFKSL